MKILADFLAIPAKLPHPALPAGIHMKFESSAHQRLRPGRSSALRRIERIELPTANLKKWLSAAARLNMSADAAAQSPAVAPHIDPPARSAADEGERTHEPLGFQKRLLSGHYALRFSFGSRSCARNDFARTGALAIRIPKSQGSRPSKHSFPIQRRKRDI